MSVEVRLENLRPAIGSVRNRKRKGRGPGSGNGGTSTRGHKGAKSRSGYSRKKGFEGGQMPLQRRLPKFGFNNPFRVEYSVLNLSDLEMIYQTYDNITEISPAFLYAIGKIQRGDKVKILGTGAITVALKVHAHAFSNTAREAIEKQSGSAIIIER